MHLTNTNLYYITINIFHLIFIIIYYKFNENLLKLLYIN